MNRRAFTDVELHSHTKHSDGTSSAEQIAEAAVAAGLHIVCLTDHHSNCGPILDRAGKPTSLPRELPRVVKALEAAGVVPVVGVEYSTRQGHLLIYGLEVPALAFGWEPDIRDVVDEVIGKGGVCVLPHPFGSFTRRITQKELADVGQGLSGIEGYNAKLDLSGRKGNLEAQAAAAKLGLTTTVASDAHEASSLGLARIRIPGQITTESAFLRALARGNFTTYVDADAVAERKKHYAPVLSSLPLFPEKKGLYSGKRSASQSEADESNDDDFLPRAWWDRY